MKKKITFCFDIDNVLCRTIGKNYTKAKPLNSSIKLINALYDNKHTIKLLFCYHKNCIFIGDEI